MPNLSENIVALRKKNNISQAGLAEKLYVTPQAVSRWERGETEPDIETINKMAEIFNVSLDEIITGEKKSSLIMDRKLRLIYFYSSLALFFLSAIVIIVTWLKGVSRWLFLLFIALAFIYCVGIITLETIRYNKKHKKEREEKKNEKKRAKKD